MKLQRTIGLMFAGISMTCLGMEMKPPAQLAALPEDNTLTHRRVDNELAQFEKDTTGMTQKKKYEFLGTMTEDKRHAIYEQLMARRRQEIHVRSMGKEKRSEGEPTCPSWCCSCIKDYENWSDFPEIRISPKNRTCRGLLEGGTCILGAGLQCGGCLYLIFKLWQG